MQAVNGAAAGNRKAVTAKPKCSASIVNIVGSGIGAISGPDRWSCKLGLYLEYGQNLEVR
ncbi:hypothetical protein Tdes44962_MAKER01103 [Teratosphaeria destructans]|uniref:Uncharacterized protein n=1 Tax=Teratosphaeria destructans TaxID=418781 RepID=A0A9W7SID9_9PEZI|nr:hypothetical protein Tdes44962_MAKER01103 [Teratosphaeria destructans]